MTVELFGAVDILVAKPGGRLQRSRVIDCSKLGPLGIRVSGVAPGLIATAFHFNGGG